MPLSLALRVQVLLQVPKVRSFPRLRLKRLIISNSWASLSSTTKTTTTSQITRLLYQATTLECSEKSLGEYTSARWLWNEKEQLRRRRISFNVTELVEVAVKATGSNSCVNLTKLPEGNFNKVFLMVMDDGKEIIAKLPNPNAGRSHFTTASEVATMDYVRAQSLLEPAVLL